LDDVYYVINDSVGIRLKNTADNSNVDMNAGATQIAWGDGQTSNAPFTVIAGGYVEHSYAAAGDKNIVITVINGTAPTLPALVTIYASAAQRGAGSSAGADVPPAAARRSGRHTEPPGGPAGDAP
jgi:hypothetical protein